MQSHPPHVLLIAVGNTLRGDDGIGHWVGQQVEQMQLPQVELRYVQQLQIDLLEELSKFDTVIVIDAALQQDPATLQPIAITDEGHASSHRADAATLKALHHKLYGQPLRWMVCGIRAHQFDMDAGLSEEALRNGEVAVGLLRAFLNAAGE